MRAKILLILLMLGLVTGGSVDALTTTTKLVFFMSTYYGTNTFKVYLPLLGHMVKGGGSPNNAAINSVGFPLRGTFTKFTAVTNAPNTGCVPECTFKASIAKNGADTAASCVVHEGLQTCVWTGSVAIVPGDRITISLDKTSSPVQDTGISALAVFNVVTTGQRNWPFAS